jgi:hypothetical protein
MGDEGVKGEIAPEKGGEEEEKEQKDPLPSWMRYLPRTPWDAKQIHKKIHIDEPIDETRRRKMRIRKSPDPPGENSSDSCERKLEQNKRSKRSESDLDIVSPTAAAEHHPKRSRSLKYGPSASIDEVSLLVSFCKVEKDI